MTGFLGAGKTTLLKELMSSFQRQRIGVIVNDFGKINVDYRLVETEGMAMAEVSNGSIFCACVKDKFVDSLIAMSQCDIDMLFIEASGLADPSNIGTILEGIRGKTGDAFYYQSALCVIDGETYLKMSKLLPALTRQVEYSDIVLVNKADRMDEDTRDGVVARVTAINPDAQVFVTTYCQFDYKAVLRVNASSRDAQETTNTPESRPVTLNLEAVEPLDYEAFTNFLHAVISDTYRFKGFVKTRNGDFEVSAVGDSLEIQRAKKPAEKTELVAISAVGLRLYTSVTKASKAFLHEALKIL